MTQRAHLDLPPATLPDRQSGELRSGIRGAFTESRRAGGRRSGGSVKRRPFSVAL